MPATKKRPVRKPAAPKPVAAETPEIVEEVVDNAIEFTPDSNTEAESVRKALQELHAENFRSRGQGVPLPNGGRGTVNPNVGMGYEGYDATTLLGNPESILKNPKPGHKYVWKKRSDVRTLAWIRSGWIRPVEADEVDTSNPMAMYTADEKAAGTFVAWESMGLFEMPPKWVAKLYGGPENWAISRLAQQTAAFDQNVERSTRGNYKGELTVRDGRVEKVGT